MIAAEIADYFRTGFAGGGVTPPSDIPSGPGYDRMVHTGEGGTMSETTTRGFTRRNFIKGAALLTAAGTLAGCAPQTSGVEETTATEVQPDEIYSGACRGNCAGGCFLNVHVRNGQVVRTTARDMPDTRYNRICTRGLSHVGRIYSSERLQYPMKRVGERGEGKFERISWDEAIDEIASKWKGYSDEFGPESMAVFSGSGNYAICSGVGAMGMVTRFVNVVGASTIPLNVDAAHGMAFGHIMGAGPYGTNNEPADYENANVFICWGANPSISQPQVMHFILDARDKGAKYVVIDEIFNANAAMADWFVPVKASTDGALAMGALHEVIEQGWIDEEFAKSATEAPLLVKEDGAYLHMSDLGVEPTEGDVNPKTGEPTVIDPYVVWDEDAGEAVALTESTNPKLREVGEVNGIKVRTVMEIVEEAVADYTPDAASELCGVPADDIRELARTYAQDGPVTTYAMFGDDHYINGHYNYWPIYALAGLTGNVCKEGAGLGFSELTQTSIINPAVVAPTDSSGNPCQGAGRSLLVNQVQEILDTGEFAGEPLTLKGVYVTNTNPLATMANHEYTVNWFKQVEFVVVADMNMTETAKYADILLPVAHWFEQTDMYSSYGTAPFFLWQEKAIEPSFESKPDFEIYKLLAEKMGYGEYMNLDPEGFIAEWLDSDAARELGVTFDAIKENKAVRVLPGEHYVAFADKVFGTPTARFSLYRDTMVPAYNIGQDIDMSKELTLYWEPAKYAGENSESRKKYPYHMLSEHMRTRTHTQWWEVGYMDEYEPDPIVRINPDDAKELGLAEGDEVRLYNDLGSVTMKCVVNAGLPRGTVSSGRSFQAGEFIDGHFASLPSNEFNQVCANQAFNDVAVAIEKA